MLQTIFPLVSVIVPVYNVKDYLEACIESIVNQSFDDFELILIDDGSSDGSSDICDIEASKDKRIRVIHKENEGVSVARNTGIECAGCEWITFIDSDDTVEKDYLKILYQKAQRVECDLITSGIIFDYGNDQKKCSLEETEVKSFDRESDFIYMITQELITSPVGKLFKRHIIVDKCLRFDPSLSFAEDRDFNIRYLNAVKSACSTSYVGYRYRMFSPGSLTKLNHPQRFRNDYKYWTNLKKFTQNKGFNSLTTRKMLANRLFHLVCDQVMTILGEKTSLFKRIRLLNEAFSEIDDFDYIVENKSLLEGGNRFLNNLILHRQSTMLSISACLLHGRNG